MSQWDDLRRRHVDLAQPRLGSDVVFATDDFFADKSRLISPAEPVFTPGLYDDNGKWMDGWESRRKRVAGHDWCVVRLGVPGVIAGLEIDTRHFTGNYPPGAMVEVCRADAADPGEGAPWTAVTPDWSRVRTGDVIDLLAMAWGGRGVIANDEHFGRVENLTAPGRGTDMGDGWETRRRREPGHDWAILELGAAGLIEEIEVDTAHFKGNYPDRCSIQASVDAEGSPETIAALAEGWPVLLPETRLEANHVHVFRNLAPLGPVRFVRLNIFPDGGVSRLRVRGTVAS
jgi:allantoicase